MVVIDCQGLVGLVGLPPIVSRSSTDGKISTCIPQTGHPLADHDHDKVELEYPSGRLIETNLEIGEGSFHASISRNFKEAIEPNHRRMNRIE